MDKHKALDKGNCGVARPRGKEAGVKPTSPRTGTGYKAGDADEFASQNEVPESASQVKPGVVSGKARPLPRETCAASSRLQQQPASTATGNRVGERAGVSRSPSSAGNEPGVSVGSLQTPPKAPEGHRVHRAQTQRQREFGAEKKMMRKRGQGFYGTERRSDSLTTYGEG